MHDTTLKSARSIPPIGKAVHAYTSILRWLCNAPQTDIQTAFSVAIELNLKGDRYQSTDIFIAKLREKICHFS